jgi:hypothetical protein
MTIVTNPEQEARLLAAFGIDLNLGRDATAAEVKQATIQWWRVIVQSSENVSPPMPFNPI